jgi:hypothetical protein
MDDIHGMYTYDIDKDVPMPDKKPSALDWGSIEVGDSVFVSTLKEVKKLVAMFHYYKNFHGFYKGMKSRRVKEKDGYRLFFIVG